MRIVRYILFCSLALILVEAEDEGAKKSAKGCDVTLLIKLRNCGISARGAIKCTPLAQVRSKACTLEGCNFIAHQVLKLIIQQLYY